MLQYIKIKNLFNRFNYDINFSGKNVSIITGPNGYGKSTILKIIDSITNGRIDFFVKIEFKSIEIGLEDKKILIKKENNRLRINDCELKLNSKNSLVDFEHYINDTPYIRYIDESKIFDRRIEEERSYDELFLHYLYNRSNIFYSRRSYNEEIEEKLNRIRKFEAQMGKVRFISAQRLYKKRSHFHDEEILNVIEDLPNKLQEKIQKISSEYASVSNKLDGTYTKRLLESKNKIKDDDEYKKLWEEADAKFKKLKKYQLVDLEMINTEEYNAYYSTALKIYFDDFAKKYSVFEPLVKKLDLFTDIINTRFLFKKIIISKENGFKILDEEYRKEIKLKDLSSGEQQEIVLFYDLIFNIESDLLLLIDEPEISLHVLWQKMFLNDLLRIVQDKSISVIVATHSPQIISGHWDIQIDLGELYEC